MKNLSNVICFVYIEYLALLSCVTSTNGNQKVRKENTDSSYVGTMHAVRHTGSMSRHMLAQDGENEANFSIGSTTPEISTLEDKVLNQTIIAPLPVTEMSDLGICPSSLSCSSQPVSCFSCTFNYSCIYGTEVEVSCNTRPDVQCQGPRKFVKKMKCRYCYQTDSYEHSCIRNITCRVVSAPRQRFITKCKVHNNVLCLGNRLFAKNILCNWTKGYSWSTALLLSISLGGLGADRFYLGLWQEGIGKLFSFGGLGVWTLVDVILIATGYLGPADGSLYIS